MFILIEILVHFSININNGFIRNNFGFNTCFWRKFVSVGNEGGLILNREQSPINFPLIRFADVLLMLAESYNELDQYDNAIALINRVRARPSVNMPGLNSGPIWLEARTKDEIFKRIVHERAIELAGEGVRYSDLRRWHLSQSLLNGKKELQLTGEPAVYTRVFNEREYLWPIPGAEIEMNPALEKNPGW